MLLSRSSHSVSDDTFHSIYILVFGRANCEHLSFFVANEKPNWICDVSRLLPHFIDSRDKASTDQQNGRISENGLSCWFLRLLPKFVWDIGSGNSYELWISAEVGVWSTTHTKNGRWPLGFANSMQNIDADEHRNRYTDNSELEVQFSSVDQEGVRCEM